MLNLDQSWPQDPWSRHPDCPERHHLHHLRANSSPQASTKATPGEEMGYRYPLGLYWGNIRVILGLYWDNVRVTLGVIYWGYIRAILGLSRGDTGVMLGLYWGYYIGILSVI